MTANRITDTLQLVKKSQDGDGEALEELFARYYPRVLKVVRLRMGNKLRLRVESGDILQDTFGTAVRKFDDFEMKNEASFINWLSKIAERVICDTADRVSAQKRDPNREVALAPAHSEDLIKSALFDLDADFVVPLDQLIRNEERELLDACIEELPDNYREPIVLRNYIGLSFKEIALQTDRPSEGAARMMHAKAMRELVKAVERGPGEAPA